MGSHVEGSVPWAVVTGWAALLMAYGVPVPPPQDNPQQNERS
ncbi:MULTISPECIES: hypothetical protein [unclassified Streptomyces]|nr:MULTISPECIES: hypothetical protein [unclassified Streptomyces]